MDSILISVKKMLGIEASVTHFDMEVIMHINSALMTLNQLGIGDETGFSISDDTAIWTNLFGDRTDLDGVKTYIYLKVKLVFDPPSAPSAIDSMERQITMLEWRLNTQAEGAG
jgi:hypothetical protein